MQTTAQVMRTMRPGFFRRTITTTRPAKSSWSTGPSPPRLPKEEQEIFEKLQQQSSGAFSTPRTATSATDMAPPTGNQTLAEMEGKNASGLSSTEADSMLDRLRERARLVAKGDGEELHPNVRRGAPPEFEGDKNPNTGEVGGPKNEPLRWGAAGDYSYNGRVTDF